MVAMVMRVRNPINFVWSNRDNEQLSIWNGSFAMISISIVNGFVAMYLIDALHATNQEIGLLNSLPSLINLFSMLAAALALRHARSKKKFCVSATMVSRSFFVWIALVPLLPISDAAIWVVWLVALTRIPQSFGDLSWQAMIGEIIPTHRRSGFFSERNRVTTIVALVATFSTGLILQQFDNRQTMPYQLAFLATVAFSVMEVVLLIRHDETVRFTDNKTATAPIGAAVVARVGTSQPPRMWRRVWQDKKFLAGAGAMLFFNFAWQMSWPLFNLYQIKVAHAPALWMGLFVVANSGSQVLTFRWWGRMAERFGTGRMLAVAALGMTTGPLLTIVSTNMYVLFVVNIFTGAPVAGVLLLLFNYLLELSPREALTGYISYYNVGLSVVGFIAPEIGIWMLGRIGMSGGMLTSALLRVVAAGALWYVAQRAMSAMRRDGTAELSV